MTEEHVADTVAAPAPVLHTTDLTKTFVLGRTIYAVKGVNLTVRSSWRASATAGYGRTAWPC